MTITKQLRIDSSHPSLAGHFPGNPIVPGVVILGEVLAHIGESLGESVKLSKVPSVKFHSPLRPNESLQLTFDILPDHLVTFSCQVGSRRIASGQFLFQAHDHISSSPL
jgi:3-hydroxymyristoyl/3-hydroxydecanoyl-(acyl carrier protein) dehydratase